MMKKVSGKLIWQILVVATVSLHINTALSQSVPYPAPLLDQSYIPPSPNAQAFQTYGNTPMALSSGLPSISLPVYQLKCGSLSLPISLDYAYSGMRTLQDAGWVGLGWNLNAGGVVTRIVEGNVDSSEWTGYNYGQYNIYDSLFQSTDLNNFLSYAYTNFASNSYDMALDVFDCEFNGYSGRFFWDNGKAYQPSYNKDLSVSWPTVTGPMTITTQDGTTYLFGATETTTDPETWQGHKITQTFTSAWFLTRMISADKKDTILFNYTQSTWQQAQMPSAFVYVLGLSGATDLGSADDFATTPSIQTQILQSINFIPGPARTDVLGTSPSLAEIDIIDNTTGSISKKNLFAYEYFENSYADDADFQRLKLKRFTNVDLQSAADSQTYVFKYISEYDTICSNCYLIPAKGTNGIDHWGYSNGANTNATLLPPPSLGFYNPAPPSNNDIPTGVRTPNFAWCSVGALDTLVYPTGGFTVFSYGQNTYRTGVGTSLGGPGICIDTITDYANTGSSLPSRQKIYGYGQTPIIYVNNAPSNGILINYPNYSGPSYSANSASYTAYAAQANGAGVGGINPEFYYSTVTETTISGNENHMSAYSFRNFSTALNTDVRLSQQVDYVYDAQTGIYNPLKVTTNNYTDVGDTSFLFATPYLQSYVLQTNGDVQVPVYTYFYNYSNFNTGWTYLSSSTVKQYDARGDSLQTATNYTYTSARNLSSVQQVLSDGNSILQILKHPEDYSSSITGNMVASHVLNPVIEQQTWLQSAANPSQTSMVSGEITAYNQTIFKPDSVYSMESASPVYSLNNQTTSGGLYTSLLSDSRYVLKKQLNYDQNNNVSQYNKTGDMNNCIIWDYIHSQPVAQVRNTTIDQVAYTSFEADGSGSWVIPSTTRDHSNSITGTSAYNLSNGAITRSGLNSASTYTVSYWSMSGSYSVTGTTSTVTGKTVGTWTYYEHTITGTSSVSVSGSGDIDELRLYPSNAQMTTYTYLPLIGMTNQCDLNNKITYYYYDGLGRLNVVKDQDGNIIKTVNYHFQGH